MSRVAMPPMRRFGYADSLAAGSIAAGGTLGILIPPSVILVIYGILTESDIGKLFIAGMLPGLLGVLSTGRGRAG
jgi:TRAP-type C4-dicarboxylate transport system permease large subunit